MMADIERLHAEMMNQNLGAPPASMSEDTETNESTHELTNTNQ
jgi:hypothetical protein